MIYRVSAHFKELFKMKILVIVDMQNDFINGALGTPEAQAAVGDVAKKISGFDGDLICITKDTHRSADYLKTQEGQLLPVEHCKDRLHQFPRRYIFDPYCSQAGLHVFRHG